MSELKAINAHGVRKDDGAYYDRRQADEYIAELDERHTTEITALEVSYRLQLDGLRYDKDAEIRRLKRALWLARGYIMTLLCRDFQRLAYQCNNGDYKKNLLRHRNRYYDLYEKCIKKVEEF